MRISNLPVRDRHKYAALFRRIIICCPYYSAAAKRDQIREHVGKDFNARLRRKANIYLAAYDGRELCGFCFGKEDAGTFWIEWYGVAPEHRRQGIARALMVNLARTVRKRSIPKLWCDSRTSNRESNGMLRSMGFRRIVKIRNHWYGHDFYLWEKSL